jgi:hypothetical protein
MATPVRRPAYARADKALTAESTSHSDSSKGESSFKLQLVLFGVAIAAVAFAAWSFISNRNTAERNAATSDLFFATIEDDSDRYRRIAGDYDRTAVGKWARAAQADAQLNDAIDDLYRDRNSGEQLLKSATDSYRQILDEKPGGFLETRSLFGLAQALEAAGDIDGAVAEFERLHRHPAATKGLKEVAAERAKDLQDSRMKDFYAWFKEIGPRGISAGTPSVPPMLDRLPDVPDIQVPKVESAPPANVPSGEQPLEKPAESSSPAPTAQSVPPSVSEAPPAKALPAEAPPAEAPPANAPPANAPPAEAPPANAPSAEAPPAEAPPANAPPANVPPANAPPVEAPPAEAPG